MDIQESQARIFLSHSSADKTFVRKLADDLRRHGLSTWMDEQELGVGDSIVDGINRGLGNSDYLVVVLSLASIQSNWVQNEVAAATMMQMAQQGLAVLPLLLEKVTIPPLLAHRVYADFTDGQYDEPFKKLLAALKQEQVVASMPMPATMAGGKEVQPTVVERASCPAVLGAMSIGKLRRRLVQRLGRGEVSTLWFDLFAGRLLDDDLPGSPTDACVMELLSRCQQRRQMDDLLEFVCEERPDLVND